ncbi:hypothetical protein [Pedobacter cryoconitis]|uniref:Uncharacterized protein n=1 Tax=Pedobacter cryoconitis TaxID=188932 RepID=A0A327SQA6_9SPHI|nr:hypothetical protein [Pedobacter cryoconitis]RAJ31069.1 hypothetical protein LY11_02299 [Pedobacter cryoconitis]
MIRKSLLAGAAMILFTSGTSAQEAKIKIDEQGNRICTSCDTIVLKAGKPTILLYNIRRFYSLADEVYRVMQLKEADLNADENLRYQMTSSPYAKREWDELKKHYPENQFNYSYVYRPAYIKKQDNTIESVNLLNLNEQHEGLIYWSGKSKDKLLTSHNMHKFTEIIAAQRKEKFRSAYVVKYEQDSAQVARYKTIFKPTKATAVQATNLSFELAYTDRFLPMQFFDFKGVKKVNISIPHSNFKDEEIEFNAQGQWTNYRTTRNNVSLSYKDGAPFKMVSTAIQPQLEFHYSGDTVLVLNDQRIDQYLLAGEILFKTKTYLIAEVNPISKDLIIYNKSIVNETNKGVRLVAQLKELHEDVLGFLSTTANPEGAEPVLAYASKTKWELPVNIESEFFNESTGRNDTLIETYALNAVGLLVSEKTVGPNRQRVIFKLENGLPSRCVTVGQKLSEDGKQTVLETVPGKEMMKFNYEYYQK